MLPALMHRISPAFALGSCSFRVERERESTARVTVWRHLGVTRSYTMEASFCGFDRGPFKVRTCICLKTQKKQSSVLLYIITTRTSVVLSLLVGILWNILITIMLIYMKKLHRNSIIGANS